MVTLVRIGGAGRAPRRPSPIRRRQRVGLLFVLPAVVLVAALFLVPTAMTAVMSLYDWPLLGDHRWVGLDNYAQLLRDPVFWRSLRFTTLYTLVVTAVLFAVGMGLALLVRRPRRGVGLFRTIFIMPVVLGFATASYIALWILDTRLGVVGRLLVDAGITDEPPSWLGHRWLALVAVIVLVVWKAVGLTMLLLMTGMHGISADVYEAASLDGASAWRQFRSVTLPLLKPTIALVLVLTVIGSFLAFDQFFILTQGGPDGSTTTLVFLIYRTAFTDFRLGYAAALSVALMAVLLVLTAAQMRILREEDE